MESGKITPRRGILPFLWRRRLQANPTRWASPALEKFGPTIVIPGETSSTVITSAPLARDLFQSSLLSAPAATPAVPDSDSAMSARAIVGQALDPLLGPIGQRVLADEIARATALISTAKRPKLDLTHIMRAVFYRTVIRVLSGAKDDHHGTLARLAALCGTLAEHPTNPLTGKSSPEVFDADIALRSAWRILLLDGNGVVPQMCRSPLQISAVGDTAREAYFESLLHSIVIAVEPAAVAAAATLEYCLRNGLTSPRDEFQGCVRRDPPIPFFVRTNLSDQPVTISPGVQLEAGDRLMIHVGSVFDTDPHSPWLDAFGVGASRCIGSAVAVSFLRAALNPIFSALCSVMAQPCGQPGSKLVHIDLKAAATIAAPATARGRREAPPLIGRTYVSSSGYSSDSGTDTMLIATTAMT